MDLIQVFNVTGLIIGGLGALFVFINSPKIESNTYIYRRDELKELTKKDKRKNNIGRFGMLMVAIGFALQLVAQFL